MACIREETERIEQQTLSKFATLSINTLGRKFNEEKCEMRTDFQRDRDRIIHSKSFRRLKHKTQVFLSPESDHYRTRLTHTLEVSQIARTIAVALRMNETLTEAIALGHDLGHTPFGHAGERALNRLTDGNFTHYEQSVRVCESIEHDGKGLNLTAEVLDGILCHTKGPEAFTPEGKIVRISDRIAYINHDIDDAVRGGIIKESDIPDDITAALGNKKSRRINSMVKSVVENSIDGNIKMDDKTFYYFDRLHNFLFDFVYLNPRAKGEESKVDGIIEGLYNYFMAHPEKLNGEYAYIRDNEGIKRAVVDYIAGMTDHFAVLTYSDIYIPRSWQV